MKVPLNDYTQELLCAVSRIVTPVYLVGGSVRDILLGKEPHDYDLCTPCTPDQIEDAVRTAGLKPHIIGKRFGTIGFKLNGESVEITTFRAETYTPGSRKPSVTFVDEITHDLSRRDFTINAMAIGIDGNLTDPFGGAQNLRNRVLKTVNKPYDSFNEDPLRMLRLARFAAQLNFSIDEQSERQTRKKSSAILSISKERWVQEIDKLIIAPHVERGLSFLADTRLLHYMLPELGLQVGFNQGSSHHMLDLWNHTLETVCLTPAEIDLRWAALLHDIGKPFVCVRNNRGYSNYTGHEVVGAELVSRVGPYLKWSTDRSRRVMSLVGSHLEADSPLRHVNPKS